MENVMEHNKELSIIIVNYKNFELTIKCITSVIDNLKDVDYEIIVIDNDSPNESFEEIKSSFIKNNKVNVTKNEKNSGFGSANNFAVTLSKGKYVLFLNPDIIVIEDAINKMLNLLKKNNDIGLVSGKLLNDDYSIQYSCRRILPFGKFLICRTPLSKFVSKQKKEEINSIYLMKDYDHKSIRDVDWVMGACMLIEREFFDKIGRFSKEYFMYFEDVDLCHKVNMNNKRVIYLPESQMIHLHNQESTKKINKMTLVHLKSMLKFYYKYYFRKNRFKK